MSLTHWWPLIGDTKDKITGQDLNGSTTYTPGKIGQCAQITEPLLAPFTLEEEFEVVNRSFSMSCWIKINKETIVNHLNSLSGTGQATGAILGYSNYDGVALIWYVPNKTNVDKITIRGTIRDYQNSYFFGTEYQLSYDTWTHIAIIGDVNKEILTLYINGNNHASISIQGRTGFGANGSKTQRFGIGRPCYYSGSGISATLPMLLNDVRVYDHALSQAEVKELSKALVVHYTFDDVLAEPTENILTDASCLSGHGSSWTVSTETYHGHTIYNNTVTSPGSWNNAGFRAFDITMQNPNKYSHVTISFWKRLHVKYGLDITGYITIKYSDDSTQIVSPQYNKSDWANDDNSIGKWEFITATAPIDHTKTMTGISNMYIYNDKAPSGNCDFACIQLEAKDHATPYTPSNRESMLYNETGLVQSTVNDNIALVCDTTDNSLSLNCSGSTRISLPINGDGTKATLSFWLYLNQNPAGKEIIITDANSDLAFGFLNKSTAIITCGPTTKCRVATGGTRPIFNLQQWYHIVVQTGDSTQNRCFVNGEEQALSDSKDRWAVDDGQCTIGYRIRNSVAEAFYNGQIKDLRLYYTALTDDEIKELYNCGGRISNLGDVLTGSFTEGATATKVNKNHTIETNEIYEQILPNGYQQLEYIETDSKAYINTGYNSSLPYQINCDMEIIGTPQSNYWFGQQQNSSRMLYNGFYRNTSLEFNWKTVASSGTRKQMTQMLISDTQANITINGISTIRDIGANGQGGDLYIFACRNPENVLRLYGSTMRLYTFTVHTNGIKQRDFIPARRASDNALGLYDIINNQFYTNAGSGNFIAGPTITTGQASMLHGGGLTAREIIEI